MCWDAQHTSCPVPGPPSNPLRQQRDGKVESHQPWRCQHRAPLMLQQLHEHLHMLFGHPKAAGERRFGLSSSAHHLTVCRLHDWANHNFIIRRVQHLVQPSLLWDPTGKAQLHNPPIALPLRSWGKHLPAVECQLPIHSGRKPDKSKGQSLLVSQIHSRVHISQETSLPEKSLHS